MPCGQVDDEYGQCAFAKMIGLLLGGLRLNAVFRTSILFLAGKKLSIYRIAETSEGTWVPTATAPEFRARNSKEFV